MKSVTGKNAGAPHHPGETHGLQLDDDAPAPNRAQQRPASEALAESLLELEDDPEPPAPPPQVAPVVHSEDENAIDSTPFPEHLDRAEEVQIRLNAHAKTSVGFALLSWVLLVVPIPFGLYFYIAALVAGLQQGIKGLQTYHFSNSRRGLSILGLVIVGIGAIPLFLGGILGFFLFAGAFSGY